MYQFTQIYDKNWTQEKRKSDYNTLNGISFLTAIYVPSILSETKHGIDKIFSEFGIVKMDSAANDINNIRNDMLCLSCAQLKSA